MADMSDLVPTLAVVATFGGHPDADHAASGSSGARRATGSAISRAELAKTGGSGDRRADDGLGHPSDRPAATAPPCTPTTTTAWRWRSGCSGSWSPASRSPIPTSCRRAGPDSGTCSTRFRHVARDAASPRSTSTARSPLATAWCRSSGRWPGRRGSSPGVAAHPHRRVAGARPTRPGRVQGAGVATRRSPVARSPMSSRERAEFAGDGPHQLAAQRHRAQSGWHLQAGRSGRDRVGVVRDLRRAARRRSLGVDGVWRRGSRSGRTAG